MKAHRLIDVGETRPNIVKLVHLLNRGPELRSLTQRALI